MVRVISVHHFEGQVIQTCEEPLAITVAPPDRLLIALAHHVIEVRDIASNGESLFSFPTVDQVCHLEHSITGVKDKIPSKLLEKKVKSPDALYLVEPRVATEIAEALKGRLGGGERVVFEANPGLGLLTRELLKNPDIAKLHLFQPDQYFKPSMKELLNEYPDRVKLFNTNIILLWKATFLDKLDNGSRVQEAMEGVEAKGWEEDPVVQIVGALPGSSFLRHILNSVVFQFGLVRYGRPQLFLLLNAHSFAQLTLRSDTHHFSFRGIIVLFQVFCEWELLREVDKKAFLPWQQPLAKPNPTKLRTVYGVDPDKLYLVQITLKRDLHSTLPLHLVKPFWYFLKHHLTSRKNRVIPEMERWVPGCGPRLISPRVGVFTQFGDLESHDILDLFLEFTRWPEFEKCPFPAAMESLLLKMEQVGSEDLLEDEEPLQGDLKDSTQHTKGLPI